MQGDPQRATTIEIWFVCMLAAAIWFTLLVAAGMIVWQLQGIRSAVEQPRPTPGRQHVPWQPSSMMTEKPFR